VSAQVSCGVQHTCVVGEDGVLWTFGAVAAYLGQGQDIRDAMEKVTGCFEPQPALVGNTRVMQVCELVLHGGGSWADHRVCLWACVTSRPCPWIGGWHFCSGRNAGGDGCSVPTANRRDACGRSLMPRDGAGAGELRLVAHGICGGGGRAVDVGYGQ
jgi:hypothetical protein